MSEVIYEMEAGIATITLNRPEKMNTMGGELVALAGAAIAEAAEDDSVRAVILTGAGRVFSAGGELRAERTPSAAAGLATMEAKIARLRGQTRISQLLHEMPKPTIAAINGGCAGAGLAWACACDIRYCCESARFNTAFVTAGLSGDYGGAWTLPRIVGPAKARELYLLAEKFDAAQALQIGLVSAVHPDAELMPFVRQKAARLARFAPLTLRAVKQNLNDALDLSFADLLDRESDRQVRCWHTEDAGEAARAYIEKRQPVFHGR